MNFSTSPKRSKTLNSRHNIPSLLPLVLLGVLSSTPLVARTRVNGWCEKGNETVSVPGSQASTTKVQRSYPSCTVTVYLAGTLTLASLYSDDSGTVKANPFTANSTGAYFFYADDGKYDVTISSAGLSNPYTFGDVRMIDPYFTQTGSSVSRLISNKLTDIRSVKDYGAVGDGVTDDGTALQNALNANAGGILYFPKGKYAGACDLAVYSQTTLIGGGYSDTDIASGGPANPSVFLVCTQAKPILKQAESTSYGVTVHGIGFYGAGAVSLSRGIYLTDAWDWTIEDNFFDNFGDQCVYWASGVTGTIRHNFLQNCLLVRSGRTDYVGALDIGTTDAVVVGNVATASVSQSTGNIGSGYIAGCVQRIANAFWAFNQCHISQVGMVVTANGGLVRLLGNRADLNQGHGFIFAGSQIQAIGNTAFRNSLTANNSYDGFYLSNTSQTITMIGNATTQLDSDTIKQRYGINDASQTSPTTELANVYSGNTTYGIVGAPLYFSGQQIKRVPLELNLTNDQIGAWTNTRLFRWDQANTRFGLLDDQGFPQATLHIKRTSTESAKLRIDSYTSPFLQLLDSGASANYKGWGWRSDSANNALYHALYDDTFSSETPYLGVYRTGTAVRNMTFTGRVGLNVALGVDDSNTGLLWGSLGRSIGVTFASLPGAPANGSFVWCSNCAPSTNPCTGASTGAWAFWTGAAWKCPF